jgi:predicted transcriptional regulator
MSAGQFPPFARESDTSRKAAKEIYRETPTIREQVLRCIRIFNGMTCDGLEDHLEMKHQTISARIWELRNMGLIKDSGRRRKTSSGRDAVVWEEIKWQKI